MSLYLAQSLADRLDGFYSGGVPVPVFCSAPPMQVLAIVRSTAEVIKELGNKKAV